MWWIFNDFVLFDLVLDPEDLWIFWKSIVFYGHSIPLISLMDSFELNTAMKSVLAWIKSTIKPGSGRVWAEAFVLPLSKEFRHPVIPATGWSWWFHQKRLDRSWASTKRCPRYLSSSENRSLETPHKFSQVIDTWRRALRGWAESVYQPE